MSLYPPPKDPTLTAEQLTDDPEFFLPATSADPPSVPLTWSGRSIAPMGEMPLQGPAKYGSQFVRGATMGLLGDPAAPEGLAQTLAEGAGMSVPAIGASAILGPSIAAVPVLRTFPILGQRALSGGLSGAITSAAHAGNTGGNVLQETVIGGLLGAVGEAGWAAWANRAKGASAPEQIKEAIEAHGMKALPPGPPGLSAGRRGEQVVPTGPGVPPYRRPTARVISNDLITPAGEAPPPRATQTLEPIDVQPIPRIQDPLALPPGTVPRIGPTGDVVPEQLYLPDTGSTQLQLPVDILPSGRMNRYATPTKFKGSYATAELASSESNVIAQAAVNEGAKTIRVTTTIQPPDGPPIGGMIRVYEAAPGGKARLVSEKSINMGAVKAAQVGAMPMRRMIPDYFEVVYNAKQNSDILMPVNKEVEKGIRISLGVDPHEIHFPMSPDQLSFLNSVEGRTIRQKLDLNARKLTFDDVMNMDERTARATLVDTPDAPPAMMGATIKASDDAVRARELLASLEIGETEVRDFLKTLTGRLSPKQRFEHTLAWLRARCGGAA